MATRRRANNVAPAVAYESLDDVCLDGEIIYDSPTTKTSPTPGHSIDDPKVHKSKAAWVFTVDGQDAQKFFAGEFVPSPEAKSAPLEQVLPTHAGHVYMKQESRVAITSRSQWYSRFNYGLLLMSLVLSALLLKTASHLKSEIQHRTSLVLQCTVTQSEAVNMYDYLKAEHTQSLTDLEQCKSDKLALEEQIDVLKESLVASKELGRGLTNLHKPGELGEGHKPADD